MVHDVPVLKPFDDAEFVASVQAETQHWLEKAVIGLNLCPFAKSVHVKKQVRYAITAAETADELLAEVANEFRLMTDTDPKQLDTTLLVHPRAMVEFIDYHFFLQETDALLKNEGYNGIYQIASLHPQYEFAGTEPDDIENFTNRSPYPTLHLLREESIDRAVAAFPNPDSIYERNMETLRRMGLMGWNALMGKNEK